MFDNPFSMVVAIVLIVSITRILAPKVRRRHRDEDGLPPAYHPDTERMREEVRVLKERVAVLERIATDANDRSALLDREIEALRGRD